jgi:hypothetical protein
MFSRNRYLLVSHHWDCSLWRKASQLEPSFNCSGFNCSDGALAAGRSIGSLKYMHHFGHVLRARKYAPHRNSKSGTKGKAVIKTALGHRRLYVVLICGDADSHRFFILHHLIAKSLHRIPRI